MTRNDHANQGNVGLHLTFVIAVGLALGAGLDTDLGHAALTDSCLGISTAQPVKSGKAPPSCMDALSQTRTVQGLKASIKEFGGEILFGRL